MLSEKTLLVVAEEGDLVSLLATVLRNNGFTVLEAVGAKKAISICEVATIRLDLILSDFSMAGTNALELARRIKCFRGNIPIVVMSSDFSRLEKIAACGFGFIQKPFSLCDLVDRVKAIASEQCLIRARF